MSNGALPGGLEPGRSRWRGAMTPMALLAANALCWAVLAVAWWVFPDALPAVHLAVAGAVVAQFVLLLTLPGIRAVAMHTLAQCLRMKVAGVFIILLALLLALMPYGLRGDNTLAGQIRTFFSYSISMTGMLLILVTIFLSVGVISSDVREKHIFTVATKPIARWQYVVGRWMGVVLLNVSLVALAGACIYGVSQYLRSRPALSADDRRTVEDEVFTARRRVGPDARDHEPAVEAAIEKLKSQNVYASAIASLKAAHTIDAVAADRMLREQKLLEISETAQSAAPPISVGNQISFYQLNWTFSDIHVVGGRVRAVGTVTDVRAADYLMRIEAPPDAIAHLVRGGPVRVADVDGRVAGLGKDFFIFQPLDVSQAAGADLSAGGKAEVLIDPTIQLTYTPDPVAASVDTLRSMWRIVNPTTRLFVQDARDDPVHIPATLTLSAKLVGDDGKLDVTYVNASSISVKIPDADIAVLYRVGRFEANFFRAMLRLVIPLAFMAGIGVLAGSFLSFPVGCLVSFAVLPFGLMREFLADAIRYGPGTPDAEVWIFRSGEAVYTAMKVLLPDLTSPADSLVDGMNIAWSSVGSAAVLTLVVRTLLVLLVACAIFQRRELGSAAA